MGILGGYWGKIGYWGVIWDMGYRIWNMDTGCCT